MIGLEAWEGHKTNSSWCGEAGSRSRFVVMFSPFRPGAGAKDEVVYGNQETVLASVRVGAARPVRSETAQEPALPPVGARELRLPLHWNSG